MINWRKFGSMVAARIDLLGYGLRELSGITGIDKATLSRAQNGKRLTAENYLWVCSELSLPVGSAFEAPKRLHILQQVSGANAH